MYALIGIALALGAAAFALRRLHAPASSYAQDVYHLTERSHRRFAVLSGVFAAGFLVALRWRVAAVPLLGLYVLLLILYASSFVRGFTGEDE